jgi:hypothetical protein
MRVLQYADEKDAVSFKKGVVPFLYNYKKVMKVKMILDDKYKILTIIFFIF